MDLEKVKQYYDQYHETPVQGCTEAEITQVEQHLQLQFPRAYREFLLWAGRDGSAMFYDLEEYRCEMLIALQEEARYVLGATQFPEPLPEGSLFILGYEASQYDFIICGGDDDPIVYSVVAPNTTYLPSMAPKEIIAGLRLSDWLYTRIVDDNAENDT